MLLIEVRKDGELLELDDGSLWTVIGGDMTKTITWTPTTEITLTPIELRTPRGRVLKWYRLDNQSVGESADAIPFDAATGRKRRTASKRQKPGKKKLRR